MVKMGVVAAVGLLGMGTAAVASAQGLGVVSGTRRFLDERPFSMEIGGGYAHLTESGAKDFANDGGTWVLRGVWGARQIIGVEADYLGSAMGVSNPTLGDGTLFRNGLEAMLRVGYPFIRNQSFVTPYATAGAGWNLFSLTGVDTGRNGVSSNDSTFTLPFGVGVTGGYDRYSLDLRMVYRPTFGDDMFRKANNSIYTAGLNNYGLTAALGYRF